ncbi:MAG: hypothetical protein LQ345_001998 [Seirophora villosa]|nr:MAG: hypothetical protein LQ345_001998 [Seirophora villosa]
MATPTEERDPLEPAPLRITPNRTPPRASTPSEQTVRSHTQAEASPSSQASAGPTPTTPHWPPAPGSNSPSSAAHESRTPRGPPPKRPPRPDYVPLLPTQTAGQQPRNYWENDFAASPDGSSNAVGGPGRPGLTTTGIPEFPIAFTPQIAHQPRRNLGPPPSARKGGANFYPQNAFVAPIPEEQPDSHSSFASSHVMPSSWGDGPPEYYMGSGISEEDEDEVHSPSSTTDRADSMAGDHDESTGLVRKVSIGKPGKPALKSIKGDGAMDDSLRPGQEVQFGPGAGVATFLAPSSNNNSPAATPLDKTGYFEKTMSHSHPGTASPTSPVDPRVAKIIGGLEKGGALSTAATTPRTSTQPSMSDRGGKRPARLQLAGAQQTEPRGSATSLPELIRRATRLASNLDRGRTASRIGMLEMLEKEKSRHPSGSGSISDILAAFPSPSLHTPQAQSPHFPSPLARSGLHNDYTASPDRSEYSKNPRGRKCCGLPVWAFILLCIILLLLIAAAVIIPITLIVLPRQNSNPAAGTVASCRKSSPCANGGTSVIEAGSCRCICMNGFTGASCSILADSGCMTSNIDVNDESNTVYKNATVGTSIPRLFTSARSSYSIPLDPTLILSLFSAQDLSCTDQNALITFNGNPQRRRAVIPSSPSKPRHLESEEHPRRGHPTRTLQVTAQAVAKRASPGQAAVTSNGIVFAAPSAAIDPNPAQTQSAASSATSSPSSSSSTPAGSNDNNNSNNNPTIQSASRPLTPNVLDFARTAILFILQERGLTAAVSTQESMQSVFSSAASGEDPNFNASVKDVGAGITVDWLSLSIDLGNGTVFGDRGDG